MERGRKLFWGKTAAVLSAIPVIIWAHQYGPDPGKNGVPGESNCTESLCHVGTAINGGGGSVKVTFPHGTTYTPGVKQHLTVTIADPVERKAGFQLTARLAGNNAPQTKTQAGSFTSTDQNTLVLCADVALQTTIDEFDYPNPQNCPSNAPLAYVEHDQAGESRLITTGSETYEFDWTPPATNVGNIVIYVEGNGANGDGTERGDHIYSATYTLTPTAACPTGGAAPVITSGEVRSAASFLQGVTPNSWIVIKGSNLAPQTDTWANAVGSDGSLPTSLDCVSVSVGSKPAYLYYISSTQINALAPNVGTGSVAVTVTTPGGTSAVENATSQTYGPAFFQWGTYATASHAADFTFAVKDGTFPGFTTVPAKPGEDLYLWGTGFGPTNPTPPVGFATPTTALYSTASAVTVTIGGAPAKVLNSVAVLSPGAAGEFQVYVTVPSSLADGDYPIVATVNGVNSPATVLLTVKK